MSSKQTVPVVFLAVLLVASAFLLYAHTLSSPFQFDDQGTVTENRFIRNLSNPFLRFSERPLYQLSFAINYRLGGLEPFGYHLFNTLLHALNGVLLFVFLSLTFSLPSVPERWRAPGIRAAFLSALIFVVHPVRVESVVYVSSRSVLLCSFFYLASLVLFILAERFRRFRVPLLSATVVAVLCAIGSKETGNTAPLVIALFDYCFISGRSLRALSRRRWFYLCLAATLLFGAYLIGGGYRSGAYGEQAAAGFGIPFVSAWTYLLTQCSVFWYYLFILIFPVGLNLDYDWRYAASIFEPLTFVACAALFSLLVWLRRRFRSHPSLVFWALFYFLISAPDSSFVPLKDTVFLHRLYLPSVGWIVLGVLALYRFFGRIMPQQRAELGAQAATRAWVLFLALVVFAFGAGTLRYGNVWLTDTGLWEDVVSKSPRKPRAQLNLGMAYKNAHDFQRAERAFRESFRLDPSYVRGIANLGVLYFERGETDKGEAFLRQALAVNPRLPEVHNNLGVLYRSRERYERAIASFRTAISVEPRYQEAYFNLAESYVAAGNITGAIDTYLKLISREPQESRVYSDLGALYLRKGMMERAEESLRTALSLNPGDYLALYTLAQLFEQKNDSPQAIRYARECVQRSPDFVPALRLLLKLYRQEGLFAQALELLQSEASRRPQDKRLLRQLIGLREEQATFTAQEQAFEKARRQTPGAGPYLAFGGVLEELGMQEKALRLYQAAAEIDPGSAEAFLRMGILSGKRRDPVKAANALKRALDLDPSNARAHYNLAVTYESQKITAPAIDEYRLTLRLEPGHRRAALNLSALLATQRRFDDALAVLQDFLARDPKSCEAWVSVGVIEMARGRLDEAQEAFVRALSLPSPSPLAVFHLGRLFLERKDFASAQEQLQRLRQMRSPLAPELSALIGRQRQEAP